MSSEHNAEYAPHWIKSSAPHLVSESNIPIDEYLRRCVKQIEEWTDTRKNLLSGGDVEHEMSRVYAADIVTAVTTGKPARIHGNGLNRGSITNLPEEAIVEVPCLVDGNGIQNVHVGELPQQLAAMNQTNINVHLLTIKVALTQKKEKEHVYQAALLDPHTAAELAPDDIVAMCDDVFSAHAR